MPRSRSHSKEDLVLSAMHHFWREGYSATSMDDLVKSTGVSRHGIYSDVGGKSALHLEAISAYQNAIVSPAFEQVERNGAGLNELASYFETQICLAEEVGLPGPGCFIANSSTETAPHDKEVERHVQLHHQRLKIGFQNVIQNSAPHMSKRDQEDLAEFLVVSTQGLWSSSRVVSSSEHLRRHVDTLLKLLKVRFEK